MPLQQLTSTSVSMIISNIQAAAGPLAGVLFLLLLTALADVVTGIFAALKSGTFSFAYLDSFLASHVLNKWAPILGTLIGGIMVGGVDNILGASLIAGATAQIVAYEATTFGSSVAGNLTDAANGTKGAPGTTGLQPVTLIGQTADYPPAPVAPVAPPPPPPPTVIVNGQTVPAHFDENGKVVLD